ncbi:hypothetical protein Kpol_1018p84 [Vanderwaltozyma polyspora DSM 70294]|uniref:Uncharacterized protein n=1 Tax=Vanderwaltozyma polyspora (strain ATCC 22028 / DSM 70294 / BCRC 21397 / CBS 2163 / NBRC 10782 / NRRL Y-8283 / UCD 57-17) TaxID=436907 RepID=A7TDT1_VANPO|nr:uncharacterized protein Kpol_1018p84 [Vanderwaltozyma polyspora DSM 70294]EDO19551.1 hypothetical protein Kpol_1018p84 [Vanderwaltozyma polyspora DSM 70294]
MYKIVRKFHSNGVHFKDLSKFVDKSTKIPTLKSSPTLYNPVSSSSNYKGYLRAKVERGFYYQPSQSSVTGSINSETIPSLFLAKDDPRKNIASHISDNDPLKAVDAPPALVGKSTLRAEGKTYHLKPEQIEEIKKLRSQDPEKYTRKVLAKKYNVSALFISLVASAPKERVQEMDRRLNVIKSQWHPRRAIAREDRKKRKELWYRA